MAGKIYPGTWSNGDYARATSRAVDADPSRMGMHDAMARGVDFFSNMPARMGYGTPSMPEATRYELVRLSYDYWLMITLYANHWISRRIIDGPAQDMIRAWPKLTSELPPGDLKRFDKAIRVTGTKQRMLHAIKWARLFGGSGALIVIKGHEKQLEEPLELENVGIGSYMGLIPFDRWVGVWPTGDLCSDITRPTDFNLPEYYTISPQRTTTPIPSPFRVHASRILRFTGPTVPTPEYEARNYWGISVLEPTYEEIRKRDNMSWTILNLTFRSSIIGYKEPELTNLLSGLGGNARATQQWYARMTALNEALSNQHMLFLGKDGGLEHLQTSFGGLDGIYAQFQMDIAGAAEYPVTRLFGRTITGLGQSNDADERIYEERIAMEQEVNERPQLDKLFPVICMSEFGDVPKDLDYTFPSVRVLSEEEKAQLATSASQVIFAGFNAGILTKPMALKELKQQSELTGVGTNITEEDIEAAEQEAAQAPQGMGGMPAGEDPGPEGAPPEGAPPSGEEEGNPEHDPDAGAVGGREDGGEQGDLKSLQGMAGQHSLQSQSGERLPTTQGMAGMSKGKMPSLKSQARKPQQKDGDALDDGNRLRLLAERFPVDVEPQPSDKELLLRLAQFGDTGRSRVAREQDAPPKTVTKREAKQNKDGMWVVVEHYSDGTSRPMKGTFGSKEEALYIPPARTGPNYTGRQSPWNRGRDTTDADIAGIPVTIECRKGQRRQIRRDDGTTAYDRILAYDYGFIRGTQGRDGDEVDVITGPNPEAPDVYVADMQDLGPDVDKREDEDKVLIGFDSPKAARAAFLSMYPPEFLRGMDRYSLDEFKRNWLGDEDNIPIQDDKDFKEPEHPRAKSGKNAGQFVKKGSEGGKGAAQPEPKKEAKKPEPKKEAAPSKHAESKPEPKQYERTTAPSQPKAAPAGQHKPVDRSGKLSPAPADRAEWPQHIQALKIRPDLTDVRFDSDPNADLVAVGKDSKGRSQYIYSQRFKDSQAAMKFARIKELDSQFSAIQQENVGLTLSKDPVKRDNAACARLVMMTGIRPGSDKDTKAAKQAYGATTLQGQHVKVDPQGNVTLEFVGKEGIDLKIPVTDPGTAEDLRQRASVYKGSENLFPGVTAQTLLDHVHTLDGGKFKTKDFRTVLGTREAMRIMESMPPPTNQAEYKKRAMAVAKHVSSKLGNTPKIAMESYISPAVFTPWRAKVGMQ